MKRIKLYSPSFTLPEALISLFIYTFIIMFILLGFKLIAKSEVINLNYAYLHQIRLKLLLTSEIKLIDQTQLVINDERLVCQNNQLYLIPGYQLFEDNIQCYFSIIENAVYLNVNNEAYWIGEYEI